MMKEEFENRVGIRITAEEYARVEQAYMGLPDSVNKDKFCKLWLKEAGIQSILDGRMAEKHGLLEKIKGFKEDLDDRQRRVEELESRLADLGAFEINQLRLQISKLESNVANETALKERFFKEAADLRELGTENAGLKEKLEKIRRVFAT